MALAQAINQSIPNTLTSTILVVDDEQSVCDMLAAVLEAEGYTVVTANSGTEAMEKFGEFVFDIMFTDICMDGMNGIELLQRVSQLDSSVKTVVMTAFSGYETALKALQGGAYDYLEKPLSDHGKIIALAHKARQVSQLERDNAELLANLKTQHTKLQTANRQLAELNEKLEQLALTDSLTGLKNRRFIDSIHAQECSRYLRYKEPFTIAMIDVDHFKQYNDDFGHEAGDFALKFVADRLVECTRDSDTIGRFGGEEFFIMLSNTKPEQSTVVAERILNCLRETPIIINGIETYLTVSIGLAGLDGEEVMQAEMNLLKRSDKALYYAKSQGRDQAHMYDAEIMSGSIR